ncbi:hypothetical protein [Roseateles sp.]|uniref:hypothetical protein n=1 Tax=Roseateles sp. TaxID=1971397 RepID=UPI00286B5983|nr:hypothetical protein [Roseateles sp.]
MRTTIKQGGWLTQLMNWGQDPQAWISMLAVVTLLGLASGTFDAADSRSADKLAQVDASTPADEKVASLDAGKL